MLKNPGPSQKSGFDSLNLVGSPPLDDIAAFTFCCPNGRPYRAWGHPYSTVFCLVIWSIVTLFQAITEPETALFAVVMVAVSWPVYRYLVKSRS